MHTAAVIAKVGKIFLPKIFLTDIRPNIVKTNTIR